MRILTATAALVAAAGVANAQYLMVPDQSNDRVLLFSATDGSLVNADFITQGNGTDYEFGTPKEAIQVGNEIWVADQITDQIARFSLAGAHIATISGGLDNIRGLAYANGRVYVSNSGTNNGAPGAAVVMFDLNGNNLGFFAAGDPFDVLDYNGELLVPDIDSDAIARYSYSGTYLGAFHDSDGVNGIDFPQQVAVRSTGTILAAGFSSPAGIYEYDSTGAQIAVWNPTGSYRGVAELLNGNILFTDSSGVYVMDPETGSFTAVITGFSAQYASPLVIPAPAAAGVLALAGLAGVRRRR